MYEYKADYLKNYDGDTITFLVDLGFGSYRKIRVRLLGVDTPEMRGGSVESKEKAKLSKIFVEEALSNANEIVIKTELDKSFDRYLAHVTYDGIDLSEELLAHKLAEKY